MDFSGYPDNATRRLDHVANLTDAFAAGDPRRVAVEAAILGHYVGSATWLGQGPADEIRGLHIDGKGNPVPTVPAPVVK